MANGFLLPFKTLIIKALAFRKALTTVYQLTILTVQLVLSAANRSFLSPLSICPFFDATIT